MPGPWNPLWRAWLYAIAWLLGAVAFIGLAVWIIAIIAHGDWLPITQPQRIEALKWCAYIALSSPAQVLFALSMRTAIRQIKGSYGGASFETSGRDDG